MTKSMLYRSIVRVAVLAVVGKQDGMHHAGTVNSIGQGALEATTQGCLGDVRNNVVE